MSFVGPIRGPFLIQKKKTKVVAKLEVEVASFKDRGPLVAPPPQNDAVVFREWWGSSRRLV